MQELATDCKGLLIHVGADGTSVYTLGFSSPIYTDRKARGRFEFLPIIECLSDENDCRQATSEHRRYEDLCSRNDRRSLQRFVPAIFHEAIPHCDPNFTNFTYCEPVLNENGSTNSKANALCELNQHDFILFVSSLVPMSREKAMSQSKLTRTKIRDCQAKKMAKYIVGYFEIQNVLRINKRNSSVSTELIAPKGARISGEILERIRGNAHFKRKTDHFVCAIGFADRKSALLQKASRITEWGFPFDPNPFGEELYGDVGYPRGIKRINHEAIDYFFEKSRFPHYR